VTPNTQSISETREGQSWLQNFHPQDRPTAKLLIESLKYLDLATLRSGLISILETGFADDIFTQPALVLPVRTGRELGAEVEDDAIAFQTVSPGDPIILDQAGSEAVCANFVREFRRTHNRTLKLISPESNLEYMKREHIRSIILVGDYAGSGSQAVSAANLLTRNRTIQSWRSFGWIRIHIVLHSAAISATRALKSAKSIDNPPHIVTIAPDFSSAGWSEDQANAVTEICQRYAQKGKNKLGWKSSAGLYVMQHTVPNNLPKILHQTRGPAYGDTQEWHPLFPNRSISEDLSNSLAHQSQNSTEGRSDRSLPQRSPTNSCCALRGSPERRASCSKDKPAAGEVRDPTRRTIPAWPHQRPTIPDGRGMGRTDLQKNLASGAIHVERVTRTVLSSSSEESR
jgi:hypothetical protein